MHEVGEGVSVIQENPSKSSAAGISSECSFRASTKWIVNLASRRKASLSLEAEAIARRASEARRTMRTECSGAFWLRVLATTVIRGVAQSRSSAA